MTSFVLVERRGAVAILTFNRPETMNAIAERQDCVDLIDALADRRSQHIGRRRNRQRAGILGGWQHQGHEGSRRHWPAGTA